MFSAWLCIEFYSYPELAVTNHGYPFLVLFDHFMAPAGNSEKSEQGREESLFRPNRTGMFCVTIIVYYSLFWRPGLNLIVDSYLNSHACLVLSLMNQMSWIYGQTVIFLFINTNNLNSHPRLVWWMLGKTRREG